jgi:hypothetical protein
MAKQLIGLSLAALGACAQQQSHTPLAKLGQPNVEIVASGQVNVQLHVDESGGCPLLSDDVTAQFDGQPMMMTHGGYDENASGCYPIAFWFNAPPMTAINGFEKTANASQLVIKDASQTWSVNTTRLFANNFVNDTTNSQIVWTDVDSIASAQLLPPVPVQIQGNAIHYPTGSTIEYVDALAHPVPTLCDGPAICQVNLQGERDWRPTNP